MDNNGNPIEGDNLSDGGTITGDLEIVGDQTITGDLDVQGTLTAQTIIAVDEIKVSDAIIQMAVDNPGDAFNMGVLEEFKDGTPKFSGLLRSKDDKQQYLLEAVTPIPTTSTDITGLPRGNLILNNIGSNRIDAQKINIFSGGDIFSPIVKTPQLSVTDSVGILEYTLPPVDGTAGQIIETDGNGALTWQTPSASGGDVIGPVLSTDGAIARFDGVTGKLIQDSVVTVSDLGVITGTELTSSGSLTVSAPSGQIQSFCTGPYTLTSAGSSILLQGSTKATLAAGSDDAEVLSLGGDVVITSLGNTIQLTAPTLSIGTPGLGYELPVVRGTVDQILKTNGAGVVTWEDSTGGSSSPSYGYIGFTVTTQTVISVINTWYPITGVYSAYELADFTHAGGVLTYTGAETQTFLANVAVSWEAGGPSNNGYSISIFKNGVLVTGSDQGGKLDNSNPWPRNCSTVCLVELSTNDTVDFRVRNLQSTQNIDIWAISATITTNGSSAGANPFDQDLNTNSDVEFNATTYADWTLKAAASQLQFTSNVNVGKYTFDQGSMLSFRSDNTSAGFANIYYKSRGALTAPTAVLDNDGLSVLASYGFDGGVFNLGSEIITKCTQDWNGTDNGTQIEFKTVDNDTVGPVQKIKLGIDGLSVGPSGLEYSFPVDNSSASSGDTILYNTSSDKFEFGSPRLMSYSSAIPTSVNNTTVETDITDVHASLVLPPNTIKPRSAFRVRIGGLMQTLAPNQIMSFRLKMNGVTIAGRQFIIAPGMGSLQYFKCDIDLTYVLDGPFSLGLFTSNIDFGLLGPGGGESAPAFAPTDSTVQNTITVTYQWTVASPNNNLTVNTLSVEQIN